jgi:hypothetical protein
MTTADAPAVLTVADRAVAEYTWRPDLPAALAPRPYLHPVRTLAGVAVTELMPASHRHHLGVSMAVAEIDGVNFWGGRTYVAGHGPAWLDNQGVQAHVRWLRRSADRIGHTLSWTSIEGMPLLSERRELSSRPAGAGAWALTFAFTLTNATDRELLVRSPAAHGRVGAGYGGFFWRAPAGTAAARVASAAGDRVETVHGGRSPWLSVGGRADGAHDWTLLFIGGTARTREDPWFVRTRDYLGVGSALAWDGPLPIVPGESLTRRVVTVVADGVLPPERIAAYVAEFAA